MSACFASSCPIVVRSCISNDKSKELDFLAVSDVRWAAECKGQFFRIKSMQVMYHEPNLSMTGKSHSSYPLYVYGDYQSMSKQGHRSTVVPTGS